MSATSDGSDSGAEHWTRYWRLGNLHSCPNAFCGNYSDELGALWRQFFLSLDQGARVLDIGTGNGAIAFLARDASRARGAGFEIHAIDAAQIEPARAAATVGTDPRGISFHGRLPLEANGFESGSFDAITGQYALEYTDLPKAAAEIQRLLKESGRGLFVIHHADALAVGAARFDIASIAALETESPLAALARRYIQHVRAARSDEELKSLTEMPEPRHILGDLNAAARRVHERARSNPDAAWLEGVAVQVAASLQDAARLNPQAAIARLDELESELAAHRRRLADILRCAHTAQDIARTRRLLQDHALDVPDPQEIRVREDHLVGWVLRAIKPMR